MVLFLQKHERRKLAGNANRRRVDKSSCTLDAPISCGVLGISYLKFFDCWQKSMVNATSIHKIQRQSIKRMAAI